MADVIETGKNIQYRNPEERYITRSTDDDAWPIYYGTVDNGRQVVGYRQKRQKKRQTRTVTATYEWSVELVANGAGTPLAEASQSSTQIVTAGCETVQVLPGKDVVKRWKETIDFGSWTDDGVWVDIDPVEEV